MANNNEKIKGFFSAGHIYQKIITWGAKQYFLFSKGYNPRFVLFLKPNSISQKDRTLGLQILNSEYTGWAVALNKNQQLTFCPVILNQEKKNVFNINIEQIESFVPIYGIYPTEAEHLATKQYVDDSITSLPPSPDLSIYALKSDLNNYVEKTIFESFKTTVSATYVTYNYLNDNYYNTTQIDSNYYNKTQIDNNFLNYYNKTQIDNNFLNYYNKTQIDNNFSNYYNKTQIDNNFSNYYNKTQIDNKFTNYYTQTQIDNNFANYYNKTYIDNNYYNKTYIDNNYYNKTYIGNNYYNKTYIDNNYYNTTQITTLLNNYYNKTQINNTFSNYYNKTQIDNTFSNYYDKPAIDNKIHQLKIELRKGGLIPPCSFKQIILGSYYVTFISCHPITGQWVAAYGTDINHNQHRFINGFFYSNDDGETWQRSPWYNSISYSQTAFLVPNQTGWSIFFLGGTYKVNIISDIATETIGTVQTVNQVFTYHALNFAFSHITNKIYFSDQTYDSNRYVRLWSSSDKGSNWVLEDTDNIWKMGGDTRFILCHNPATATIFVAGTQYLPGDSGNTFTSGVPGFLYILNSNTIYTQNVPLYYNDTSTRYNATSIAPCLNGEFYITGNSHFPMLVRLSGSGERVTDYQLGSPLFCMPHYPSNTTMFVGTMSTHGGLSRIHTDNNAHTPIIRLYDSHTARIIVGTMTGYGEHSTYGTSLLTGTTIFCNGTGSIWKINS